MIKRGINKKSVITIISLISAILFSTFAVLIANLVGEDKQNVSNNTHETVSALVKETDCDYVFGGYGNYVGGSLDTAPTKAQYNSWTNVGIENAFGLIAFSHSVANGYTFEGKTVYLLGNIEGDYITNNSDLGNYVPIGANMWSGNNATTKYNGKTAFKGTFDGQGFTITNLTTTIASRDGDSNDIHLGFFAQLTGNAIVQNLRINNFTITGYAHNNDVNTLIGGIVGYVNQVAIPDDKITIQNCLVSNLNVNTYHAYTVVGGLVGYAKVNLSNELYINECAVNTIAVNTNVKCDSIGGLIAKTYGYYSRYIRQEGDSISYSKMSMLNCHIKNLSVTGQSADYIANLSPARGHVHYESYSINQVYSKGETENTAFFYNISKCVSQGNNGFDAIKINTETRIDCTSEYVITEKDTTTGLTCSSVGGESSTFTWYYAASYNGGYPYLRQFLSWTNLGFSLYGDDTIEQWVSVPSDGVGDAHNSLAIQLSNLTLDVFGQSVTAGKTDPYDFNGWTKSGNNYYAQFSLKTFKVSFVGQSNTTNTSSNLTFNTDYYIYYDGSITISYTSYSKQGYSSITYTFTDTGGTTRSITYYPTNGHYLTTTSIDSLSSIRVYSEYSGLSVKTAQKVYTPSFE
ncbi:MAG: hypothetical protein J6Q13_02265 [Clostridia bacterium]|nr:hypothetical protein [Clostridia bacterium]